jgi:hypothetical protein
MRPSLIFNHTDARCARVLVGTLMSVMMVFVLLEWCSQFKQPESAHLTVANLDNHLLVKSR